MDSTGTSIRGKLSLSLDLALGFLGLAAVMLVLTAAFGLPAQFWLISLVLYVGQGLLIVRYWPRQTDFGWANRATLLRSVLVLALVGWAPYLGGQAIPALWAYAILSLVALLLDGVDGKVARATGSHSTFGARFDMELDALFILGLCMAVIALDKTGSWVLALGLMRYLFLLAAGLLPWLNAPLPDSFRRKTVCVWQVVTLMVAVVPLTPALFASLTLGLALALLAWSFCVDVRWLHKRRQSHETLIS
ncbi:CDP-alcohol phosphatidyltransferase family protein [Marinobacter sp. VGCF2001]|uniref:CDP-alcohol phosphatidyltransferase family protein n=1 Tax=Marinobacter sp. VGCF2001 TaxID=3417189 RepID=UPI003CE87497